VPLVRHFRCSASLAATLRRARRLDECPIMHVRLGPLLVVLALTSIGYSDAGSRWLLAREMPKSTCLNTVQGRWHVTDDQGFHCPRDKLDDATGCCKDGVRHSCKTCRSDDCCTGYEQCVSCCMAPQNDAEGMVKKVFRGPNREETGRWSNAFEYCRGKCRTNMHSTVHENAYLAPNVYCYSALGKPMTEETAAPPLPAGMLLVAGQPGDSCDRACQAQNVSLTCEETALPSGNNCNILREHFNCEAGCGLNPLDDGLPGYVVPEAEKSRRPTMCWTRPFEQNNGTMRHRCSESTLDIRRLCPCSKNSAAPLAIV
jgi:hypothetical protein